MILIIGISCYFLLGFFISLKTDKYAWIDFFWASAFLLLVILLAIKKRTMAPAEALLGVMYLIWSLRLSLILFSRLRKSAEDPRYLALKSKVHGVWILFLLYLVETALVFILAIPLYQAANTTSLDVWCALGVAGFLVCLTGEAIADRQKSNFRSKSANKDKVCNVGLWKYSRHPNYFFEIGIWFFFGVFNLGMEAWFLSFIPFVVMTFLITKVTGFPPSEKQSLKNREKAYKHYQKTTNCLIPWFPKKG